jgi:glycosyltransferase involved in cell wall biosynthesis
MADRTEQIKTKPKEIPSIPNVSEPIAKKKKGFGNRENVPHNNADKDILMSVVIPLLDEEESLPELSLMLESELRKIAGSKWEVIFIDDGSKDKSFEVIKEINARNKRFKCIRFRRNYGKSAALAVGFRQARGKYVATMDADLQDDPKELENLLNKIKEGYDLVSGWKKKRYDPISKTLPSKFFNFVTSIASGVKLHDFNCGLKLYRREVIKTVNVYGEMHRYIPALAHWEGFKVTELPVSHHPRQYGKTKFGLSRFVNGFLDLLTVLLTTRYMKRPLHFFGATGSLIALLGLFINIYLTIEWVLGNTYLSNRPLALFGIGMIIVGVQFISIGLIAEIITKSMNESQSINYSIKEKIL